MGNVKDVLSNICVYTPDTVDQIPNTMQSWSVCTIKSAKSSFIGTLNNDGLFDEMSDFALTQLSNVYDVISYLYRKTHI